MDFDAIEERDGIRWSWNVWPNTRLEGTRIIVPLGCNYTPMKENVPLVYYDPVHCRGSCKAVLNPYCAVDIKSKLWTCPFCLTRNAFPANYTDMTETNLPAELIPNYTTIEYCLPRGQAIPPVYIFVIDTCLPADELEALKSSVIMSLTLMPQNSLVGLITFGKTVQLYELGFEEIPKCYVFNGAKDVTVQQVADVLGLSGRNIQQQQGRPAVPLMQPSVQGNRFLRPVSEVDIHLTSILEELQRDPNRVPNDRRPLRCTGAAISTAIGLLEVAYQNSGGRLMVFTGGAVTHGPGMIASEFLKEPLRSHTDISKENAKYTAKAIKYYESLTKRAVTNGHAVDFFECSLDQCGFYEISVLCKQTGGLVVMADSFDSEMFKDSFRKIFGQDEKGNYPIAFNGTLEVQTSKEIKVCGAIGTCASAGRQTPNVSETEIGHGKTSAWKLCSLDPHTTVSLYFEVVNQTPTGPGQRGFIQFLTNYQNANGQKNFASYNSCKKFR